MAMLEWVATSCLLCVALASRLSRVYTSLAAEPETVERGKDAEEDLKDLWS